MRTCCLLVVTLCVLVAGCGSSSGQHRAGVRGPLAPPAPGHPLSPAQLRVELTNGFHAALYRVAVMSQPGEEPADLGQRLPTGTIDGISCHAPTCRVTWTDVKRRHHTVTYRVRLTRTGCFEATAVPPRRDIYDATTQNFGQDPLGSFASLRRGC